MSIPSFLGFVNDSKQLDEAFNSAPYELTMGKKNAGDVFFTFVDEDEKEFRIQFYTPQGLGKNVRQVFIGQKRGSVYPDAIARFKNPMRVIASMIEATKQFLATPIGKTIDGFAINFSKKALDRGTTLLPKIIRQSGLKQKLNVMDLSYTPVPDRAFVWVVRKGKDPVQVFDGPKMKGITWDDPDVVGDTPMQSDMGASAGATVVASDAPVIELKALSTGYAQEVGVSATGDQVVFKSSNIDLKVTSNDLVKAVKKFKATKAKVQAMTRGFTGAADVEVVLSRISSEQGTEWKIKSGRDLVASITLLDDSIEPSWSVSVSGDVVVLNYARGRDNGYIRYNSYSGSYEGELKTADGSYRKSSGPTAQNLAMVVQMPEIPASVLKDFEAAIQANAPMATKGLKEPSNGKFKDVTSNSFTILWNFKLPSKSKYADARLSTTYSIDKSKGMVTVTTYLFNGKVLNGARPYDIKVDGLQRSIDEKAKRYQKASADISMVNSESYNPSESFMDDFTVDAYGEISFQGRDLSQSAYASAVVDALSRAPDKKAQKTGADLATYAGSIRDNAPKGRDLDWRIYATKDAQSLNVEWSITFRRNNHAGAFQEFRAQINSANRYIQELYADAKRKGYNPTEPNLLTQADAERADEVAYENGGSDYSEYEQAIGGNIVIKI